MYVEMLAVVNQTWTFKNPLLCYQGFLKACPTPPKKPNKKQSKKNNKYLTIEFSKCVGGAKWKPFSSPVIATLGIVGVLGECF